MYKFLHKKYVPVSEMRALTSLVVHTFSKMNHIVISLSQPVGLIPVDLSSMTGAWYLIILKPEAGEKQQNL